MSSHLTDRSNNFSSFGNKSQDFDKTIFNGDLLYSKVPNATLNISNSFDDDVTYTPTNLVTAVILTIFGGILLVGILGNILVMVVIATIKSMRTSVNKCLFSLAVADLFILVFLPIGPIIEEVADNTVSIGANLCNFINLYETGARVCSILIFLYVTIDRYFALCHPLMSRRLWVGKRLYGILLAIWIVSLTLAVPYLYTSQYQVDVYDNVSHYYCTFETEESWMVGYETYIQLFVFYIPVPFFLVLYGRMIHRIRASVRKSTTNGKADEVRGRRNRGQVVILLLTVLVIFIISQLPFATTILLYYHLPNVFNFSPYDETTFAIVWISRILIYVNSASNPVVYFSLSTNFRRAFLKLLCCEKMKPQQRPGPLASCPSSKAMQNSSSTIKSSIVLTVDSADAQHTPSMDQDIAAVTQSS